MRLGEGGGGEGGGGGAGGGKKLQRLYLLNLSLPTVVRCPHLVPQSYVFGTWIKYISSFFSSDQERFVWERHSRGWPSAASDLHARQQPRQDFPAVSGIQVGEGRQEERAPHGGAGRSVSGGGVCRRVCSVRGLKVKSNSNSNIFYLAPHLLICVH